MQVFSAKINVAIRSEEVLDNYIIGNIYYSSIIYIIYIATVTVSVAEIGNR